jgi:hypothetical protein
MYKYIKREAGKENQKRSVSREKERRDFERDERKTKATAEYAHGIRTFRS